MFDSFEGAIHALAPVCEHRGVRLWDVGYRRTAPSSVAPTASGRSGRAGYATASDEG